MVYQKSFTFIDLFAGVGGMRLAFERAGGECVFSSEWDRYAQETYEANFAERPLGDIREIPSSEIPRHDVLVAGFPCQPFSKAGHRKGFRDTRGTLFFEVARILFDKKPKIVLLENVKGLLTQANGTAFETIFNALDELGYETFTAVLNASEFGLPQNRERVFIVGIHRKRVGKIPFKFPKSRCIPTRVGDILESQVDSKYVISDKLWLGHQRRKERHVRNGNGFGFNLFHPSSPRTRTISARYYKDGSEILIARRGNPRRITPREAARLQGFPDSFVIPVSDTQAYKQFGNAVPINVVTAIAREIAKILHPKN